MAIMGMVTAEKTSNTRLSSYYIAITSALFSVNVFAGEWQVKPNLGLTETLTNNIELNQNNQESSLVNQFIIGANANYISKKFNFDFMGSETLVNYSHDSQLNDDYQTLQAAADFSLWQDKLKLIANSSINNIAKNDSSNSLGNLITADTVQQNINAVGVDLILSNNNYSLLSSLFYSETKTGDNIGESEGYTAIINSENGNAARHIFWQLDSQFIKRENGFQTSENYQVETKVGAITSIKLNPFIRFYDEKITGSLGGARPDSVPSWGPGIRYKVAKNFTLDLSYNYVDDDSQVSNDYVAASIDWQPSARTSLKADYSKRFFGNSYGVNFSHRTKKLENTITYNETIEVFDRSNFQTGDNQQTPAELIEDNEFSLNKRLDWQTQLSFVRTNFNLTLSNRDRESLSSGIIDNYFSSRLSMTRRLSVKSNLVVYIDYNKNTFNKNLPSGPRQEDTYKIISTSYNKKLASLLTTYVTIQYLDRQSNLENFTYDEGRISINLTKDF
jgi:uncharacterized protein (PEP-CTERM system associated)